MHSKVDRLPISRLRTALTEKIDIFICSASYEKRCLSIAAVIAPMVSTAFVCHHRKLTPPSMRNLRKVINLFEVPVTIPMERGDPLRTADALQATISRVASDAEPRSFAVDITTFTHEELLILLSILRSFTKQRDTVLLLYTTAAEYSVGLKAADKWLSKGVKDVRSVLGFPGSTKPSRRSHLIVLAGFEEDRAVELIESYEPHVLSLGFGEPGTETYPGHGIVNKEVLRRIASKVGSHSEFEFSTTDPLRTKQAIERQINRVPGCNVLIAPMNTKISTVGAAAIAFQDDSIRLCYASPLIYNSKGYSSPGKICYLIHTQTDFWQRPGKIGAHSEAVWTKGAMEYADVSG